VPSSPECRRHSSVTTVRLSRPAAVAHRPWCYCRQRQRPVAPPHRPSGLALALLIHSRIHLRCCRCRYDEHWRNHVVIAGGPVLSSPGPRSRYHLEYRGGVISGKFLICLCSKKKRTRAINTESVEIVHGKLYTLTLRSKSRRLGFGLWMWVCASIQLHTCLFITVISCILSSRSGVATLRTAIHLLLTYLF